MDKPKQWTPSRMLGEVKVMCSDCNGYLWSDGESERRPEDYSIPCPVRNKRGGCGYVDGKD